MLIVNEYTELSRIIPTINDTIILVKYSYLGLLYSLRL
ncbi:hypothetical protein YN1HA_12540 [Sulfurisphaera ohwakuensis]